MTKRNKLSYTRLYRAHYNMKRRVLDEKDINYHNYGGRGITICDEWLNEDHGFMTFYNWALENGYQEDLTLERKNVNGNYEPNNCEWIPWSEQAYNKQNTVWITIDGDTKTLNEWSKLSGIERHTIQNRMKRYDENKSPFERNTTSGEKYIHWDKDKKKWRVRIRIDGVAMSFGKYSSLDEAIEKRNLILIEHNMNIPV